MSYIYKITNTINNKMYIGQHNGSNNHYYGSGVVLKKAINKYGKENFNREVVVEGDFNKKLLNDLEKHYIRIYNTFNRENYNLTEGGHSTYKRTEKHLQILRDNGKYGAKNFRDPEFIEFMRGKNLGNTVRKGSILNESVKESIRYSMAKLKGKPIIQMDKEGVVIAEYRCIEDARRFLNKKHDGINKCLNGKAKTAYGFTWKLKSE